MDWRIASILLFCPCIEDSDPTFHSRGACMHTVRFSLLRSRSAKVRVLDVSTFWRQCLPGQYRVK
eukprot:9044511-Pyramimonas_sp.AAC.1